MPNSVHFTLFYVWSTLWVCTLVHSLSKCILISNCENVYPLTLDCQILIFSICSTPMWSKCGASWPNCATSTQLTLSIKRLQANYITAALLFITVLWSILNWRFVWFICCLSADSWLLLSSHNSWPPVWTVTCFSRQMALVRWTADQQSTSRLHCYLACPDCRTAQIVVRSFLCRGWSVGGCRPPYFFPDGVNSSAGLLPPTMAWGSDEIQNFW